MDLVSEFREFLEQMAPSLMGLAALSFGFLILMSLAAREAFTWLTRNDKIRRDMRKMDERLARIEEALNAPSNKSIFGQPSHQLDFKDSEKATGKTKESAFQINH